MRPTPPRLLLLVLVLGLAPLALGAESSPRDGLPPGLDRSESVPPHQAAAPDAPAVTEENLLASERFWPYHVALTAPYPPGDGAPTLRPGMLGVLVRVEKNGHARIDFGGDGLGEAVPVGKTDLVERANRIRRGELDKEAPNFVWSMGPRLMDAMADERRTLKLREVVDYRGFLTVFADPETEDFAAVARTLAPLREREGVLTIVVPQGEHSHVKIRKRLRELDWPVAFVISHLVPGYTRSLLPTAMSMPAVVLQTDEGRVLFQSEWDADALPGLRAALDAAFGAPTATASAPRP